MYTGNTLSWRIKASSRAVYPCVYREHFWQSVLTNHSLRFIPVYTGNTSMERGIQSPLSVYPCVYREHSLSPTNEADKFGLSLCIQGTRYCSGCLFGTCRFIPVYTGNTPSRCFIFTMTTVYPCVYREHRCNRYELMNVIGLSLCIQGTPLL